MSRVRIRLASTPYDDNAATVSADVTEDGDALTVQLLHAYPDLEPVVGWWLAYNARDYELKQVSTEKPYQLACTLKGGA